MTRLLHLRLGRFFAAVSGNAPARQPWRSALGRADGMAATLEMTARLDELAHRACRAIEWRSATEAWMDLGTGRGSHSPWAIADQLREATTALLPVEIACGVAATKSASRAASALAAPSGLLVVLPGYERAILSMAAASRAGAEDPFDDALDAAPFRPSLVPRAVVRSAMIEAEREAGARRADHDGMVESLVQEARAGLNALGVIASTVRVQFANAAGVREAFATLPDPTAIEDFLQDAVRPLARRVLHGACGSGQLLVSLGQLIPGPAQASLFGWRYDHSRAGRLRRFA